jgi:hypothetical protein
MAKAQHPEVLFIYSNVSDEPSKAHYQLPLNCSIAVEEVGVGLRIRSLLEQHGQGFTNIFV